MKSFDDTYIRDLRRRLLEAVFEDNLERYTVFRMLFNGAANPADDWEFPDQPGIPYRLGPTHLCRSHVMAVRLGKHDKVNFRMPDEDGHMPLYFIARYAKDKYVIPYLAREFNLNADYSGRNLPPPIYEALAAGNCHGVRGLEALAPRRVDLNIKGFFQGITPLIYSVLMAEAAVMEHARGQAGPEELNRKLRNVRFLAASPVVDPKIADTTHYTAEDYAVSSDVVSALKAGLARRNQMQRLYETKPWLRMG